jgi:hypothetical protein
MLTEVFKKQLDLSDEIHIPLPIEESETQDARLMKKPVLENRLLSDGQSMEGWSLKTARYVVDLSSNTTHSANAPPIAETYAELTLSDDYSLEGTHSIKFSHPTNLDDWPHANRGRIYAEPGAMFTVDREDWREWNRLSLWVYPVADGMKSITGRLQLHNDGERKVPDKYIRDGHHNVTVKNRQWNHITLEIPYLDRDTVVGVSFEYDMVGHEPDAADEVLWYINKLELQKVEADLYETWVPGKGRIAYSHSGYQPGSVKVAIISDEGPKTFKLVEMGTGKVVLEKNIINADTLTGKLRVLDFTEAMDPGRYMLIAGDITSRAFTIDDRVWETSIWKTLNFFLVLRCGYEVPGVHRACHSDLRLVHGEESIIANGGWHDAADLAQGMHNTAEATAALLALALSLRPSASDGRLFKRVMEEAKWGLDYVLKTRFSDGYRSAYSSSSIWTDGVMGTKDDIVSIAQKSAWRNFDCAYAEALGAKLFKETDPDYARYCIKIAKEDFKYAEIFMEERKSLGLEMPARRGKPGQHPFPKDDFMDVQVGSFGAMAAAALYAVTGEDFYMERAIHHIDTVIACQQQELTDWDVPMVGFFYQDLDRDLIWHHNHMSYASMPDVALREMCETFPDHPLYMKWYHALVLSGEYYGLMAEYTLPYGVVPAGVYHEDELDNNWTKTVAGINQITEEDYPLYREQVRKGFPVGKGYYIRVFPVWFSFRGNYKVLLSESKSMESAALVRNDYRLQAAAQSNYEWIVGKNPFCQSTMYGEGYDYAQLYAVQPGQAVGSLSVGMQSHDERDVPYWPQVNTATYKEVWVCPPTKWMWCMADSHLPSLLEGYMEQKGGNVFFVHKATGRRTVSEVHPRTGYFYANLPAGYYDMTYNGIVKGITVVNGKRYLFDGPFFGINMHVNQEGADVTIQVDVRANKPMTLLFNAENLSGYEQKIHIVPNKGKESAVIRGKIDNPKKPWVGLITSRDNPGDKYEVLDKRLTGK